MSVFTDDEVKDIDSMIVSLRDIQNRIDIYKNQISEQQEDNDDEDDSAGLAEELDVIIGNLDGAVNGLDEVIDNLEQSK